MRWFGQTDHVLHALATVQADRDADGHFLIAGAPVITEACKRPSTSVEGFPFRRI
jgi:hypothetical protein